MTLELLLDSIIAWFYYYLILLLLDSTFTWLYYYLTLLWLDSTIAWLYYYLTLLLLSATIAWLHYYLTLLLLDSTMTCSYYFLTSTLPYYHLTPPVLDSAITWPYYSLTLLSLDFTFTWPYCYLTLLFWLYYYLTLLLLDSTSTWLYYHLTPLILDASISWLDYYLTLLSLVWTIAWRYYHLSYYLTPLLLDSAMSFVYRKFLNLNFLWWFVESLEVGCLFTAALSSAKFIDHHWSILPDRQGNKTCVQNNLDSKGEFKSTTEAWLALAGGTSVSGKFSVVFLFGNLNEFVLEKFHRWFEKEYSHWKYGKGFIKILRYFDVDGRWDDEGSTHGNKTVLGVGTSLVCLGCASRAKETEQYSTVFFAMQVSKGQPKRQFCRGWTKILRLMLWFLSYFWTWFNMYIINIYLCWKSFWYLNRCCCPIDPRSDALEQMKTVALARAWSVVQTELPLLLIQPVWTCASKSWGWTCWTCVNQSRLVDTCNEKMSWHWCQFL